MSPEKFFCHQKGEEEERVRIKEIERQIGEQIKNLGWRGRSMEKGGVLSGAIANILENYLPFFLVEVNRRGELRNFNEETKTKVIIDLLLSLFYRRGQRMIARREDGEEIFSGQKPGGGWSPQYREIIWAMVGEPEEDSSPFFQVLAEGDGRLNGLVWAGRDRAVGGVVPLVTKDGHKILFPFQSAMVVALKTAEEEGT